MDLELAVAGEGHGFALVVGDRRNADQLDDAAAARLAFLFFDSAVADAADVERAHGELGARFADGLGGDDADRHAFLDKRAGGQVHAVAEPTDAERGFAGHRAADNNVVDAELFDVPGLIPGDHFVFFDNRNLIIFHARRDRMAADSAADRLAQGALDFLPLVNGSLGNALR